MFKKFSFIIVVCLTRLSVAYAVDEIPMFSDIVIEDANSSAFCSSVSETGICYMNHKRAIDYCASQGQHLPSAREWAKFLSLSENGGAKGIVGSSEPDSFVMVQKNLDGTFDKFNFSHKGYKNLNDDLRGTSFWSSSYEIRPQIEGEDSISYFLNKIFEDPIVILITSDVDGLFYGESYNQYARGAVRCALRR